MRGSLLTCDNQNKQVLLADDAAFVRESIARADVYDFACDVRERLDALGLSVNAFAKRANVSHTMVNKWLAGTARPNGKERMKELGMALGMNEAELDEFLLANCYTKLYRKNPLDDVCKLMIKRFGGTDTIVAEYRKCIDHNRVRDRGLPTKRVSIPTANITLSMDMIDNSCAFGEWLDKYHKHFAALDKWVMPSKDLIRFVLLYVGDSSINEMYTTGTLPASVRNLLYPLARDEEVVLRGLRNKLIVFGLCNDMTEDEIDLMLYYARLRTLSQARTALDIALVTAVRCAHERYPYFEFLSLDARITSLREIIDTRAHDASARAFYEGHKDTFEALYANACDRVAYYDLPGKRGEEEELFEKLYGENPDAGLAGYVCDVLEVLAATGDVERRDVGVLLDLLED